MSLNKTYGPQSTHFPLQLLNEFPQPFFHKQHFFFQSSEQVEKASTCATSVFGGLAASIFTGNPMPLFMVFGGCLPRVSAQQKIGNEFQINTYTNNSQSYPSVENFINGNFVVTWQSFGQDNSDNANSSGIFGQLFSGNATPIGNEFQINTYTNNSQSYPSVASFSNGNFVVTWQSDGQDGSQLGVYGQLFDGNGSEIGNEFQVNTYTDNDQGYPAITRLSNGNFVVTWVSLSQVSSNDYGIFGQIFTGNGSRIGSEFPIYTRSNIPSPFFPSITSLSNNTFVVAWHAGAAWYDIFCQRFDRTGTKIGSEFQVNTFSNKHQTKPSVASLMNDNFVVTWESFNQQRQTWGIFGQLFDRNGNKIGNELTVYEASEMQFKPFVINLNNDHFVVTWSSYDLLGSGATSDAFGQLFIGNGSKIGNEFQVNTYTNNSQWEPSVASLGNGNFVVTWISKEQDGSIYGIFGQIFNDFLITSSTATSSTFTTSTTSTTTSPSTSTLTTCTTTSPTTSTFSSLTTSEIINSTPTSSMSLTSLITTSTAPPASSSSFTYSSISTSNIIVVSTSPKTSSLKRTRLVTMISLGVGGLVCFCVAPLGFLLLRKRKSQTGARFSEETAIPSTAFELKPVVQRGHKVIGEAYLQFSTLVRAEAEEIYLQTGHLILFPEGQKKLPYVIGSGQFGKIKVAQRIEDKQYVASKKVKGEENMRASEAEAQIQKAAAGENVLPIYNTIRLEDALYHFMPLAGLGDGSTIQRRLALLNQSPVAITILTFIAQNILTGLQTIHAKGIDHLDMKPDNLVFTKDGTAYITDFGCARMPESRHITGEALGDNRYFSPERLRACQEGTFDAEKADMWAAGVTLLQIFYNQDPLELLNMPHRLAARVERCNQAHFDQQLRRFSEVKEGSIWWVIKGLLDTNPKTRLTATQALKTRCFQGLDKTQQKQAFEELRRETFAQHEGIEQSEINLGDYGWVMQRVPEEERGQGYRSKIHQKFYRYSTTPDLYRFTPDQVTASSSASEY